MLFLQITCNIVILRKTVNTETSKLEFLSDYQYLWSGQSWSFLYFFLRSGFKSPIKYLYNSDPLKPRFYIVKLGFTGVYIIFLISAQNHTLWVPVRTAPTRRF